MSGAAIDAPRPSIAGAAGYPTDGVERDRLGSPFSVSGSLSLPESVFFDFGTEREGIRLRPTADLAREIGEPRCRLLGPTAALAWSEGDAENQGSECFGSDRIGSRGR